MSWHPDRPEPGLSYSDDRFRPFAEALNRAERRRLLPFRATPLEPPAGGPGRLGAFEYLRAAARLWSVQARTEGLDPHQPGMPAIRLDRHDVELDGVAPRSLPRDLDACRLRDPWWELCFLEGVVLVKTQGQYGAFGYDSLTVLADYETTLEVDRLPGDAVVSAPHEESLTGAKHVVYGVVRLRGPGDFEPDLLVSSLDAAYRFVEVLGGKMQRTPPAVEGVAAGRERAAGRRSTRAFDVLGLSPYCTPEEAAAIYRRLASGLHPDVLGDLSRAERAAAEARLREINAAYDEVRRLRGWR